MRIDKLTSEQEALIPVVRDEWLGHGLSTEPADRDEAVRGVAAAYRAAKLDPPQVVVWLNSPLAGCIGSAMVWGQVWDQVWGQVGGQVWGQVWGQVRDQVRDQLNHAAYGQHDSGWLSFHDFFARVGLEQTVAPLTGLQTVAKATGWWWPFRGAVVLTERPRQLHRDAQTRLHNTAGPALLYPDGWGIWAVHGVRVPAEVIENKQSLTVEQILAERNTEVRRVMIELFGWERFAESGTLTLVHEAPDPANAPHTVRLFDLPPGLREVLGTPVRLIVVTNATPERSGEVRSYGLTVPVEIDDAVAAVAWTAGVDKKKYLQLARAT